MRKTNIVLLLIFLAATTLPATELSPYAGMQQREIKALSDGDVTGYLSGHGMGLAKAAELNSYPGPKHVLELTEPLGLNESQILRTEEAFRVMHEDAVRLGAELVDRERELDVLFAGGQANAKTLEPLVRKLGKVRGELRLAHLQAHLTMRSILSSEQIQSYDTLRGYRSATESEDHTKPEQCPHDAARHER